MRRILSAFLTVVLSAALFSGLAGPPAGAEPAAAADPVASKFTPTAPVRVLDTRNGTGTGGTTSPVGPGATITLDLATRVPATATAVVLNLTGVAPSAATYVTAFPAGTARPTTSNLHVAAGQIRANQVTVVLGADRKVSLYNFTGRVHLLADLAGHYGTGGGAGFTPLPAYRVLDTRWDDSPVGPGATRVLDLTDSVPTSATSVTFNLTAVTPSATTYVTAWPTGTSRPTASHLNVPARLVRANQVTVSVGADRLVSLYNFTGTIHLAVDVTGFHTPEYGASFLPLAPRRVLDTRNGTGGTTGKVGPDTSIHLDLTDGEPWSSTPELPLTATGAVLNLTGVAPTTATYLTAWGSGIRPSSSALNLAAGETASNAAVIEFGSIRDIELYNSSGSVHLVADLAGVFAVVEPPCTEDCVYAWGDNRSYRKLGTAEAWYYGYVPTRVALSGVRAVAPGYPGNGYALRTDGTVWAWGNNNGGQLGNGWLSWSDGGSAVPVPVVGLTDVTAVAAGSFAAYALRSDGTVWSWGSDNAGQLGNGAGLADSTVPVRVGSLTGIVAISARNSSGYALRADGTLFTWGAGPLGNGAEVEVMPVPVSTGLTDVTAVAAKGSGAYALREDGTVWSWGDNDRGQLGDGQPCPPEGWCQAIEPVQVSGLTDVVEIAGGRENGYARRADGSVWAWGAAERGRLGSGVDCAYPCEARVPVRVSGLSGVTQLASFDQGGYALLTDGSVRSWGDNSVYSLGDDRVFDYSTVPVPAANLPAATAVAGNWQSGYAVVPTP